MDYQETLTEQQEVFDRLDELGLTKEQKSVTDQAITANNHFGAVYGAVAYRLGMYMLEIGIMEFPFEYVLLMVIQ